MAKSDNLSTFSRELKDEMIDLIREHPCIWNSNEDGYRSGESIIKRRKAYEKIANRLCDGRADKLTGKFFIL